MNAAVLLLLLTLGVAVQASSDVFINPDVLDEVEEYLNAELAEEGPDSQLLAAINWLIEHPARVSEGDHDLPSDILTTLQGGDCLDLEAFKKADDLLIDIGKTSTLGKAMMVAFEANYDKCTPVWNKIIKEKTENYKLPDDLEQLTKNVIAELCRGVESEEEQYKCVIVPDNFAPELFDIGLENTLREQDRSGDVKGDNLNRMYDELCQEFVDRLAEPIQMANLHGNLIGRLGESLVEPFRKYSANMLQCLFLKMTALPYESLNRGGSLIN